VVVYFARFRASVDGVFDRTLFPPVLLDDVDDVVVVVVVVVAVDDDDDDDDDAASGRVDRSAPIPAQTVVALTVGQPFGDCTCVRKVGLGSIVALLGPAAGRRLPARTRRTCAIKPAR
jgi:hypothetical protein